MKRPAVAEVVCRLLRLTLVPLVVREVLQRRRVTILFYHRPSPQAFASHVRALRAAYTFISLGAFLDALEHGSVHRLPAKSLVLTFDDGHRSNFDLIEIFRALPARPTVFLCSGLLDTEEPFWFDVVNDPEPLKRIADEERLRRVSSERRHVRVSGRAALAAAEIEQLKPYVDFQSHTVSHPILPRCDEGKAFRELAESRADLERRYGLDVFALAYPNGDHSEREVRLTRQAGYRCAVTTAPGLNGCGADPFRLHRVAINDDEDGPNVVLVKASGVWAAAKALRRLSFHAGAGIRGRRRAAELRGVIHRD